MSVNPAISVRTVNALRILAAEGVETAKSGHPGLPMGAADIAWTLWHKYLRHNPANPQWFGRDRFVLSAGHGSMLLYSLLHCYGYGLEQEDLKQFRQWGSRTPGHPEFGHTAGVEVTTGPLGSGFATAVGMAMAGKHFDAVGQLSKSGLPQSRVFVLAGDGCMMEGVVQEAASLAGHLNLDNLICIYDDNQITIEGDTTLAFTEDVAARFVANGWRIVRCGNANDLTQCDDALAAATAANPERKPTLLIARTAIGYGAPSKQGKSSCHGEPLGEAELLAARGKLGLPQERSFEVSAEVREVFAERRAELITAAAKWDARYQAFLENNPEVAKTIASLINPQIPADLPAQLLGAVEQYGGKSVATRQVSGDVIQIIAKLIPAFYGGSADLAPSTKTLIKDGGDFCSSNYAGRNLRFGVREFAMGLIGNGLAIHGTALPYTSTFFVFSDYMKPAIRLAALQQLHQVYVFTHDSFYVGEDGPTHQPVEHIAMLRSIPGMTVYRPADANETAIAWASAITSRTPVALLLTRQNVLTVTEPEAASIGVVKGAYVVSDSVNADLILIATGSEVASALEVGKLLRSEGRAVRVVSMPSWERFVAQSAEYRETVLPKACTQRVVVEAGTSYGWHRWIGSEGLAITLDTFGASAPANVLCEKFGFTVEAIAQAVRSHYPN